MKGIISIALAVVLVGCSAPYEWTGEWEGWLSPVKDPKDPIEGSANRVSLTVKPSGEAVFVHRGVPSEGEVNSSGNTASFLGRTVLGQPIDRQPPDWKLRFQRADLQVVDKDHITIAIQDGGGLTAVALTRKPQPASKP